MTTGGIFGNVIYNAFFIIVGGAGLIIYLASLLAMGLVIPTAFFTMFYLLKECIRKGSSRKFFSNKYSFAAIFICIVSQLPAWIGYALAHQLEPYVEKLDIYLKFCLWISLIKPRVIEIWAVSIMICFFIGPFVESRFARERGKNERHTLALVASIIVCTIFILLPVFLHKVSYFKPSENVNSADKIIETRLLRDNDSGSHSTNDNVIDSPEGTTYVINKESGKFHRLDCGTAYNAYNRKTFEFTNKSSTELVSEGYSPCGNCDP